MCEHVKLSIRQLWPKKPVDSCIIQLPGVQSSLTPNRKRIDFKVATLTYKVLCTQQPAYLYNLISYHQPSRLLRSSSQSLLHVPRVKTDLGCHAFSSAAPQIWNHIPTAIKVSPSLDSFKRHLKTHYFTSP